MGWVGGSKIERTQTSTTLPPVLTGNNGKTRDSTDMSGVYMLTASQSDMRKLKQSHVRKTCKRKTSILIPSTIGIFQSQNKALILFKELPLFAFETRCSSLLIWTVQVYEMYSVLQEKNIARDVQSTTDLAFPTWGHGQLCFEELLNVRWG